MGRNCGYPALMGAIAGGAEAVLVPEFEPDPEELIGFIRKAYEQGKSHFIVVAAEGARLSAAEFDEYVNSTDTYESRLTVVGHAQRGGDPTAFDRILGSRFGTAAVEALAAGESGVMIALSGELVVTLPLDEVVGRMRPLDPHMYKMAGVLSALPGDARTAPGAGSSLLLAGLVGSRFAGLDRNLDQAACQLQQDRAGDGVGDMDALAHQPLVDGGALQNTCLSLPPAPTAHR
jgi:Phosphofructokinase